MNAFRRWRSRTKHRARIFYFKMLYRRWRGAFPGMKDPNERRRYRHQLYTNAVAYWRIR